MNTSNTTTTATTAPAFSRYFYEQAVWSAPLDALTKMALLALLRHADNHDGACHPSQETLARKAGMGVSTLRKHLAEAEAAGWFVSHTPGLGRSKRYRLTIPPDLFSAPINLGEQPSPHATVHTDHRTSERQEVAPGSPPASALTATSERLDRQEVAPGSPGGGAWIATSERSRSPGGSTQTATSERSGPPGERTRTRSEELSMHASMQQHAAQVRAAAAAEEGEVLKTRFRAACLEAGLGEQICEPRTVAVLREAGEDRRVEAFAALNSGVNNPNAYVRSIASGRATRSGAHERPRIPSAHQPTATPTPTPQPSPDAHPTPRTAPPTPRRPPGRPGASGGDGRPRWRITSTEVSYCPPGEERKWCRIYGLPVEGEAKPEWLEGLEVEAGAAGAGGGS